MQFANDIKVGMLQVRENEISLREWFAHLRGNPGCIPFTCYSH